MFWGIMTVVLLTNCDELASLSLTRSRSHPHRDGGAGDRALSWEKGWGVPQGGQVLVNCPTRQSLLLLIGSLH